MIQGYHEYKHVWENSFEDDKLICEHEIDNAHDTHAVALWKNIDRKIRTVGHIPGGTSILSGLYGLGRVTSLLLSSFLSSFSNGLKYFSIDIFTCTTWPKLTHVIMQVNGEKTLVNFMQFTKFASFLPPKFLTIQ